MPFPVQVDRLTLAQHDLVTTTSSVAVAALAVTQASGLRPSLPDTVSLSSGGYPEPLPIHTAVLSVLRSASLSTCAGTRISQLQCTYTLSAL